MPAKTEDKYKKISIYLKKMVKILNILVLIIVINIKKTTFIKMVAFQKYFLHQVI